MENTKRDLSLDFTKPRRIRGGQLTSSLVTPILNLSTPELQRMISGDDLAVLTPNGISSIIPQSNVLPSPLIPTTVISNNIIHCNNTYGSNDDCNNSSHDRSNNGNQNQSTQKQAPSEKSIKKVDPEKIEKKRERNRLAAKKCRQRKLETIDDLRKNVSDWEQKYKKLEMDYERFKNLRNKEVEKLIMENTELKNMLRQ